jgi:glycosyltransferase involved in cell wall biosynthesis
MPHGVRLARSTMRDQRPTKPRLLYYTELSYDSMGVDDSFVQGVIKKEIKPHLDTIAVYYDRHAEKARQLGDDAISIPYRARGSLIEAVASFIDPAKLDFVIVRNTPPALRGVLSNRARYGYKVGFHPTFPHALRRLEEARLTRRGRLRKHVEYFLKRHRLNGFARRCDFILSTSSHMIEDASLRQTMTFFEMPGGFDADLVPTPRQSDKGPMRFVYQGSFDLTRRMDVVLSAFDDLPSDDWQLEIFTADFERAAALVQSTVRRHSGRVRVNAAIERAVLFEKLTANDIGICMIPTTPLYAVSSPLKMAEYYACGIPAIMSPLPACRDAFADRACGFFSDFDRASIRRTLEQVLSTDRDVLKAMGAAGRALVMADRTYRKIATDLANFLLSLK